MRTTFDQEMDPDAYRDTDRGMGRQNYREQAADEPDQAAEPHDLTLGLTALAGIFLAVVLVCAVFFGFGYSTGRTLHGSKSPAAQAAPASSAASDALGSAPINAAPENTSASTTTPPLSAAQPVAKPSAGAPLSDADAASRDQAYGSTAQAQTAEEPTGFPPAATPLADGARPASARVAMAAVDAPASALPATTGGVMVQIAAVMRPADADMLAHALRTNGYAAIVRIEPQDKFLHVQVGPFPTRDQAKAMRARLQGDGYNAFLKP